MKKILLSFVAIFTLAIPRTALAHCPLCVAGAGALAVLATSLGVSSVVVGILTGAFALALGLWLAPFIKKQYIPYQRQMLTLLIFVSTIIPVMPFIKDYGPLYISLGGEYGTPWHNTYVIDLFLFGSLIGAILMLVAPLVSKAVTKLSTRRIPYQGVVITILLLITASVIAQIIQW
ncbi:MAG: hypothetical protein NUV96_01005 [Candidatus Colwellbacteria bacterium]|nr:hypothetical protein [Candidatus Colwellbacteria bacterium]